MKVLLTATVASHICQFHRPLAEMLHENNCQVHVAARDNLAEKNGLKLDFADKVFNVPFARSPKSLDNLKAFIDLRKIIRAEEYDIIHCNTPMGGIITRLAACGSRKKGTQVYYTAHGFHFYKGAPNKNWLIYYPVEKLMSKLTDKLITITKEDYSLSKSRFWCKVYYTHGVGFSSEKFSPVGLSERNKIRAELGIGEDDFLVLNIGELLENKNQKTAIKVIKVISCDVPEIKLFIAGNGPQKEILEKTIEEMNLGDRVRLIGYTTKIKDYLAACDALLTCSFREGLPLNVMEALACGRPVVASENRGHKELIVNGENGFLCGPENIYQYSQSLREIFFASDSYLKKTADSVIPFMDKNVKEELRAIYGF